MKKIILTIILLMMSIAAFADQASNILYITAQGAWYAKCIPDAPYEEKGKTLIYLAGKDKDELIHTFDWYSPATFISGWGGGFSVVRLGSWPRGREASEDDLAIAFYRDSNMIAKYSILDLAGTKGNAPLSAFPYLIKEVVGFVQIFEKKEREILSYKPGVGFEIMLHDETRVVFDIHTGKKINLLDNLFTRRIVN